MADDQVVFFDQFMSRERAEALQAAQREATYRDADAEYLRIAYGEEKFRVPYEADTSPCEHCGTIKGMLHFPGCEFEQCPNCGGQLSNCVCKFFGHEE